MSSIRSALSSLLPPAVRSAIGRTALRILAPKLPSDRLRLNYVVAVLNGLGGQADRKCPICGYQGKFGAFGLPPRFDAECPRCGSLERHRLIALAITKLNPFFDGARILHFAPEPSIARLVKERNINYTSADIRPGAADRVLNLENIELPEGAVDIVIANHVLEHVDDRKAISELYRILSPSGCLITNVPIAEGWDRTYEDPSITSPEERDLHFGQWDHVRYYGRDFRDRLQRGGFDCLEFVASGRETVTYSLERGDKVFLARKAG